MYKHSANESMSMIKRLVDCSLDLSSSAGSLFMLLPKCLLLLGRALRALGRLNNADTAFSLVSGLDGVESGSIILPGLNDEETKRIVALTRLWTDWDTRDCARQWLAQLQVDRATAAADEAEETAKSLPLPNDPIVAPAVRMRVQAASRPLTICTPSSVPLAAAAAAAAAESNSTPPVSASSKSSRHDANESIPSSVPVVAAADQPTSTELVKSTNKSIVTDNNNQSPAAAAAAAADVVDPMAEAVASALTKNSGRVQFGSGDAATDKMIALGFLHVNTGKFKEAIGLFTHLLTKAPGLLGAHLGRGTARALASDLPGAVSDFDAAIAVDSSCADAWKRRGQSRAALAAGLARSRSNLKSKQQQQLEQQQQPPSLDPSTTPSSSSPSPLSSSMPESSSSSSSSSTDMNDGSSELASQISAANLARLALQDLDMAVKLSPGDSEALFQRGLMHLRARRFHQAVADLEAASTRGKGGHDTAIALNHLGLVLNTMGRPRDAVDRHKQALRLEPTLKEAWTNLGQAHRELSDGNNAVRCFTRSLELDPKYAEALQLRARCHYSMGRYRAALADLIACLQLLVPGLSGPRLDALTLRGSIYHGMGQIRPALADFNQILKLNPTHTAFYHRQRALWLHARLDRPFDQVSADATLSAQFKESWCKQGTVADVKLTKKPRSLEHGDLVARALRIGQRCQYHCDGFLANTRQHLSFGLAIVDVAQRCRNAWDAAAVALAAADGDDVDWAAVPADDALDFVSGMGSSAADVGPHRFGWRDLFDVCVRWRQMSEVNDPVFWVDRLTPEQFAEGFGSHTPMVTEHTHVVRYYPNFDRAFAIVKQLVLQRAADCLAASQLAAVRQATTYQQIHEAMGHDFWVVTPCQSQARPGHTLEGTRLTVQRMDPPADAQHAAALAMGSGDISSVPAGASGGYEVSIRTPGTPPRWDQFEREMDFQFDQFRRQAVAAVGLQQQQQQRGDDAATRQSLARRACALVFYWYNFMPLSRGTAACGLVALHGLLRSVGVDVAADLPAGLQVDWQAILRPTPEAFMDAVGPDWLWSALADVPGDGDPRTQFPLVSTHCSTFRQVIETLNVDPATIKSNVKK